jgi:hypothetical protein
MNALVTRGAPRDFQDIRKIITSNLISLDDAWALWQAKNPDNTNLTEAKRLTLRHLASIELRRPLEKLPEEEQPGVTEARGWAREVLCSSPQREQKQEREQASSLELEEPDPSDELELGR